MFTLIAVLTVLPTGKVSTFQMRSPFDNEQVCLEKAPELARYVVEIILPERSLISKDVRIETKCVVL